MLHEQEQGTLATGPNQTLKAYLDQWLEQVHKLAIRTSTYYMYRTILDKHIIPALGHIRLQRLTPQQVQAFYAGKLEDGFGPYWVKKFHIVLHAALENAVRWNLVARNACDLVTPPVPQQNEIRPLTSEQVRRLLEAARGDKLAVCRREGKPPFFLPPLGRVVGIRSLPTPHLVAEMGLTINALPHTFVLSDKLLEAFITVAVNTGMRRGELLGLHWQDIDFEAGCLYVRRSVSRVGTFGIKELEPKTQRSKRKIELSPFVIETLKRHREQQRLMHEKVGDRWKEQGIVFCNRDSIYIEVSNLHVAFKRLLKSAGLPDIRFHDLRHSVASILLSMEVHPKVVQELLGHSHISITIAIYSHLFPSMQKKAVNQLDDLFNRDAKE